MEEETEVQRASMVWPKKTCSLDMWLWQCRPCPLPSLPHRPLEIPRRAWPFVSEQQGRAEENGEGYPGTEESRETDMAWKGGQRTGKGRDDREKRERGRWSSL